MEQNKQNYQETEPDLKEYVNVIIKRKKTFIAVFLFILSLGVFYILFSPRIYRISMKLQPPVIGQSLSGGSDLESAENLSGLIINGAYDEKLKETMKIDSEKNLPKINVEIPRKTNILQVNVNLESEKKEFGVTLLRNLANLISDSYAKIIDAKAADIVNQIKSNERAIVGAKDKAKNLQDQMKEVSDREDKLREEIKIVNENTSQILAKRGVLLNNDATNDNVAILLLTNFIQNNSNYANGLNNQLSDLSIRKVNLNFEFKNIDSQISDLQMGIDKLKISKDFISNLKIISQPRASSSPISQGKKKILVILMIIGVSLGMLAVFLQEYWLNNFKKHD